MVFYGAGVGVFLKLRQPHQPHNTCSGANFQISGLRGLKFWSSKAASWFRLIGQGLFLCKSAEKTRIRTKKNQFFNTIRCHRKSSSVPHRLSAPLAIPEIHQDSGRSEKRKWFWRCFLTTWDMHIEVSIHGGTSTYHPFLDGILPEINHPFLGSPLIGTPINILFARRSALGRRRWAFLSGRKRTIRPKFDGRTESE